MDLVPTMAGVFIGVPLTPPWRLQQLIPVTLCRFPCGLYHSMLQSWRAYTNLDKSIITLLGEASTSILGRIGIPLGQNGKQSVANIGVGFLQPCDQPTGGRNPSGFSIPQGRRRLL